MLKLRQGEMVTVGDVLIVVSKTTNSIAQIGIKAKKSVKISRLP